MKSIDSVVKVLENGFITQKEIQKITQFSQATVSRCLKKLGNSLLVLPDSSPRQYALPLNDPLSGFCGLDEIDEHGKQSILGDVYSMGNGRFFVKITKGVSNLYLGDSKNGLFDGLPYFLDDLRPQGFLGNQIARQLAKISKKYPSRLGLWDSKHIFQYLFEYGDDLPGNLVFGDGLVKPLREVVSPVDTDSYDFICEQIKQGNVPKSSAAGEQQKFTAFNKDVNAHVLVKYTSNENDAVSRRWKDVLVTEYHALKTLSECFIPAAEVRLVDQNNRYYLETKRFDRLGAFGRSSMFSLQAIDMEFTGIGENWGLISEQLMKMNLISVTDDYYISYLWQFSQLIGNTDTHLGNISFGIKGDFFSLLPIYDMCTMAISPSLNELDPIDFEIQTASIETVNLTKNSKKMIVEAAIVFWEKVMKDLRISDEFRDYLQIYNPDEKLKSILN